MRRALMTLAIASSVLVPTTTSSSAGTFPGDDGKIAFSRPSGNLDGRSRRHGRAHPAHRLAAVPGAPAVASPDGSRIAFSGFRGGGDLDVYTIDAGGGNRQRLTSSGKDDHGSSWSPDSARIAFSRIGRRGSLDDVFVMDADGSDVERLTNTARADVSQAFSPQGTRIVILRCCGGPAERPRLALIDADGSNRTPLVRYGFDADWQAI